MSADGLTRKKSVTIPGTLADEAAALAAARGASFSGYVTEALRRQVERDKLAELVADMQAVAGPADPAEVERWRTELR
ncbi:MAG: hypothetical protein LBO20_05655 [Bifidobacteriaceae bacterium]|jgi:phosphoribosylanthranilate isomerase|nr:hypothetical protein [Bifidobacteriaceae bacterium]